jgi:transcriptional regulator with XRE-family HTH domain
MNATPTKLMTVADVAAELGVTGQAISAWHKGESHDTPAPAFFITTPHARRKFELLWTAEQVPAWHEFADAHIVAMRESAQAKADKAIERAAKAQEAADKAMQRLSGSAEVPSVEDAEAVLNAVSTAVDAEVDVIDAVDTESELAGDPVASDDWNALTPEEQAELGGTEDFDQELAESGGSKRGRK